MDAVNGFERSKGGVVSALVNHKRRLILYCKDCFKRLRVDQAPPHLDHELVLIEVLDSDTV